MRIPLVELFVCIESRTDHQSTKVVRVRFVDFIKLPCPKLCEYFDEQILEFVFGLKRKRKIPGHLSTWHVCLMGDHKFLVSLYNVVVFTNYTTH